MKSVVGSWKGVAAALILVGLVAAMTLLPAGEWLLAVVAWVQGAGALGVVVFGVVYVLGVVAFAPGSVLTLGAGFVWGPVWGTMLVSPVSVLGATLAFLLGRTVLRSRVQEWVAGNARFAAVDEAVGRQGFTIVGLLRLSPVFPFVLLNYALGLTGVKTRHYVLASFLGMLPGTFLFTCLLATIAVTVVITRIATHSLKHQVDLPEDAGRLALSAVPSQDAGR
ncbi:MAG: TVP38/TMEM64 family protein [Deltaproteobacteria bacterium]|nr:TVP38/TMEM64 family protein [Deltaproteobacteria bacterium]